MSSRFRALKQFSGLRVRPDRTAGSVQLCSAHLKSFASLGRHRCLFWSNALGLLLAGSSALAAAPQPASREFSRVFVIVLENHGTRAVVGNPRLPRLAALAREGALATNDHGVTHPSLPNYVALIAGTHFGVSSDNSNQKFTGATLPDRLEAAGLTWKGYFQSIPRSGFAGNAGGPFWVYVKRHNPFMLFPSIADNPARAAGSVGLGQLEVDLASGKAPSFALIVPDLCHDLHGNINCLNRSTLFTNADEFVGHWVDIIRKSSAWDDRAAIVITFDESEVADRSGGGGQIPTIVLTKTGPQGYVSQAPYNHYGLLRTLTDAWNLPPLGASAAAPMNELFFR